MCTLSGLNMMIRKFFSCAQITSTDLSLSVLILENRTRHLILKWDLWLSSQLILTLWSSEHDVTIGWYTVTNISGNVLPPS